MADSNIPVSDDALAPKLQTFRNNIGGTDVHSEAVTLVDRFGVPYLPTTPDDTQPISATSLPLPAGAATAAKQLPDNHQVQVSNFPGVQPVSVASLPLPAGASTAAAQAGQTTVLEAIRDRTTFPIPAAQETSLKQVVAAQGAAGASPWPISASSLPLPAGASTEATQRLLAAYPLYFNAGLLRHVGASVTSGIASTQSFRLGNPAGSGKNILLMVTLLTPTTDATFTLNRNGTLAGATSHTPWNPLFSGSDTTVATAQTLVGTFTGGTALASSLRTAANITLSLPFLVLLAPGQSVGASATYAVGATTHVNIIYAELDP